MIEPPTWHVQPVSPKRPVWPQRIRPKQLRSYQTLVGWCWLSYGQVSYHPGWKQGSHTNSYHYHWLYRDAASNCAHTQRALLTTTSKMQAFRTRGDLRGGFGRCSIGKPLLWLHPHWAIPKWRHPPITMVHMATNTRVKIITNDSSSLITTRVNQWLINDA